MIQHLNQKDVISHYLNQHGSERPAILIYVGAIPGIEMSNLSDVSRLGLLAEYEKMVGEDLDVVCVNMDHSDIFLAKSTPMVQSNDWTPALEPQLIPQLRLVEGILTRGVHRATLHLKTPRSNALNELYRYSKTSLLDFICYDQQTMNKKEYVGGRRFKIRPT